MKIKLVRLDGIDEAEGFRYGQVLDAVALQNSGSIWYQVATANENYWFFRADQVEAV